jgi:regulator of protease activity HflC (stomatin/prohibitin superfamily)
MKKSFVLAIIAMAIVLNSCTTVDSASVGIKFHKWSASEERQGGVIGTVRGFVWYNPFTQSVYEYPTFVQRKTFEDITVNTKDAAIFKISPMVAYKLNAEMATKIFLTYRRPIKEIENGFIQTCIYEAYRIVGNAYTSENLMANRGEFEAKVRERLESSLTAEGFVVVEFTAQIMPPQSLIDAIDRKNQAIQNALTAENQIREAEAKAQIEIAKSKGDAEALKIKGDGEAYYNRVVAASLNLLLVNQYAIEKWDGKLPVYSGGQVPLISLPTNR